MTVIHTEASANRCKKFRRRIVEISQKIAALHIGSAFSCMEIVEAIYFNLMKRGSGQDDDTFIMSKGHGCLAQFVALEELGVISKEELDNFCRPGYKLGVHPDLGCPGVEASTGSLGHGFGIGLGMALADSTNKKDRTVFVVLSDGELQEGSVWEILLLAPTLKANSLVAVIDLNDLQSLGRTSQYHPNFYPVVEKLRAFGWETVEVDGHNTQAIVEAVSGRTRTKPFMLVAKTIKGKGVSYMENVPIWHYRSPNPEEFKIAMQELA